jgi:hypothetical protein
MNPCPSIVFHIVIPLVSVFCSGVQLISREIVAPTMNVSASRT